ncbi:MAG: sigma-70 family RNA polymerase sigma factor [Ruminococcaceae bacterium]|nr:sigma-70 family RNA polymerase sigma factor [Oscillospiraceae bacterium]
MEDVKITELLASRDQTGLSELKRKYERLILKVCRGILRSPEDAEEVANDTLLAVWKNTPENPDDLKAYVCRIARRKAINRFHYNTAAMRNADLLTELDECIPSGYSVEDAAEKAELTAALNEWLGTLDEKKRQLFIQRYFYMLSAKEAAKSVSMTPTAATTALLRLRESLKEFLIERKMF